jgi:transcriptional regulator
LAAAFQVEYDERCMPKETGRIELLQGTLDMLILRTLLFGPAHGHQIAKHIQRTTGDLLQVEHGSLYPALHRLERKGWISARWETAAKDQKREFKYYSLTPAGKKQLVAEESRWKQLTGAIARVMWPASEG